MKKLERIDHLNRAIGWSLKQKKYKDTLELITRLKADLASYKLPFYNIALMEKEINAKIEKTKEQIHKNIMHLFYHNLKIPSDDTERFVFGEIIRDIIDLIDEETEHSSISYISSADLRRGYVELNQINQDGLRLKSIGKILNLNTGLLVNATNKEIKNCKPVDTSRMIIRAITLTNYS